LLYFEKQAKIKMAPASQEAHRPGLLKQSNKGHKTGSHKSKGAIDRLTKGRISAKAASVGNSRARKVESKNDRRNR
jgi:pre-rRNA-processing protein TSR1